ncbi:MAG TPA: TetR/AcrR family transcriptional regulator [Vicinamibacterales bacterium]
MVNKRSRPSRAGRSSQAAIFAAAAREFAARGYDAAGVDRIAAKARVNKAMIYYHYGSKLGLYVEVLRDMFRVVGARARAIADGPGSAENKLDAWIVAIVEEAAARPWLPPIMLREVASGGTHLDPETVGMMNAVFVAVRDLIVQGQRDGVFRDADPLLTHLTIMPAVLVFFARQRLRVHRKGAIGVGAPRHLEDFVGHMQASARGMLRTTT